MAPLLCSPVVPFNPFSSPSPYSLSSPRQLSHHQSSSSSSYSSYYRVLEVEEETQTGNSSRTYDAKLWVYHDNKVVTKVERIKGPNSAWSHKFILAATEEFLSDEDSSLFVEIYRRSLLGCKKKLIGIAKCSCRAALTRIEADEKGEETCCTLPLNGVSGMPNGSLKLKLRLWREVLGADDHSSA